MTIPYRTQRAVKRFCVAMLTMAVLLAAACVCGLIWVQRYLVYTADGSVRLDFDLPPLVAGKPATPPDKLDITINFEQDAEILNPTGALIQMLGYYVETEALEDIPAVLDQLKALPAGTPVMVEVKNIFGDFFYSSGVSSRRSNKIDTAAMDALIAYLKESNLYPVARMPAFRDYAHGLHNIPDGVFHTSGGYLHMDSDGCYWLHPGREGTMTYLTNIVNELKALGFQEVVLTDFSFPESEDILVNGNRQELLTRAANLLLTACGSDRFAVSFLKTEEFTMPQGRTRMYLSGLDAAEAEDAAANSSIADTKVNLVFLTELYDTRFDAFSVLRPLSGAH